ncbi:hypothetical protein D6T64_10370 [Cryobacterium melibiosiphilum]|uniref:Type 4a pilus biogenesis protein PilO n=1 Tax=Cryobacterium melibiosiphilum TaxID=995039 RepID=A0A3A5MHH4_9MICO|nr:hypothetical protein [Cryobacterium melibiosiphilum]RJT88525.1 hypothetical protein D6T64_10370 [Cryobacterium melibiosiphilum]
MPINKILTYLATFVVAMILLLSGVLVILPRVEATVAAHAETDAVKVANELTRAQIDELADQYDDIDTLRSELAELRAAIPTTVDLPEFLLQLDELAAQNGVTIGSVSLGDPIPQALTAAVDPAAAVPAASAAPAAPAADAAAAGPFATISLSLSVTGGSSGVLGFVNGLQQGERMVSVTAFNTSFSTEADAASGTSSITATMYVLDAGSELPAS